MRGKLKIILKYDYKGLENMGLGSSYIEQWHTHSGSTYAATKNILCTSLLSRVRNNPSMSTVQCGPKANKIRKCLRGPGSQWFLSTSCSTWTHTSPIREQSAFAYCFSHRNLRSYGLQYPNKVWHKVQQQSTLALLT